MIIRIKLFVLSVVLSCICATALSQADTTQRVVAGRVNSEIQKTKPYVILISIDGMRADYVEKHHARNLARLGGRGAVAEYMLASFPSLTFPNHYTLITGLYPAHHGLVDNTFYDPAVGSSYAMHDTTKIYQPFWYGGTPLWVLAEQQKMVTASFYWVGSEVNIQSTRPTYSYKYSTKIPVERRIQIIRQWFTLPPETRPHLITLYFPEVDHEGHDHGPDAEETGEAVRQIDQAIGRISAMTDSLKLPVNFIIVSDHGMGQVDTERSALIPAFLSDSTLCSLAAGSTLAHVYLKDPAKTEQVVAELKKVAQDFDVYRSTDIPPQWKYNSKEDRYHRLGDIVLVARFPKVFKLGSGKITPGKHGYDPALPAMHATFIAWGPQIQQAGTIPPFQNIHVYPLVADILGLSYSFAVDGDREVLRGIINEK